MEPGFFLVGPNEAAAISMAILIIVDWALFRYATRPARRDGASRLTRCDRP